MLVLAHTERSDVGYRAPERMPELVPGRADLRHAQVPGAERGANAGELVSEFPLNAARRRALAVQRGDDIGAKLPALARAERDAVPDEPALDLAGLGEHDLGEVAGPVHEDELVFLLLVAGLDEFGQCRRVLRIAEREVIRLDREDVSEVGAELERELELD